MGMTDKISQQTDKTHKLITCGKCNEEKKEVTEKEWREGPSEGGPTQRG